MRFIELLFMLFFFNELNFEKTNINHPMFSKEKAGFFAVFKG